MDPDEKSDSTTPHWQEGERADWRPLAGAQCGLATAGPIHGSPGTEIPGIGTEIGVFVHV